MALSVETRVSRRSFLQFAGGAGLLATGTAFHGAGTATPIRVAVIVDTTGIASSYGTPVLQGLHLAVGQINAGGGIHGHPLQLDVLYGQSNMTRIVRLMRDAADDRGIVAVVGPTLSSEAVKADPVAQQAGLPVIAASNSLANLTAMGNCVFRVPLGDDQIIPVVVRATQARLHYKKVALLYDRVNVATAGGGRVFRSVSETMGLRLASIQTFTSGTSTFSPYLEAIKAAKPDAIFVSALSRDAVAILRQRLHSGIPAAIPIIGANGLNTPAIIAGGGAAAEGVIVGTIYDPTSTSARNLRFRSAFRAQYQRAADGLAAEGYDGIFALATALAHVPTTTDRHALRASLASLRNSPSILSPTGHFSFNAVREATLTPIPQIVRNGRFVRFP